jgi:hypothetical protein
MAPSKIDSLNFENSKLNHIYQSITKWKFKNKMNSKLI